MILDVFVFVCCIGLSNCHRSEVVGRCYRLVIYIGYVNFDL